MQIYTNAIIASAITQNRLVTESGHKDRLVELYEEGVNVDPITVMQKEGTEQFWIIDGFHRFHAQKELKREQIEVNVIGKGTERDARIRSLKANAEHRLQLARNKGDIKFSCAAAADLLKAEQLESGVDYFEVKVCAKRITEMCGLKFKKNGNAHSTADSAASAINKEAKEARDELIVELLEQGKTRSEVMAATGASESTVKRATKEWKEGGSKTQDGEMNPPEASLSPLPVDEPEADPFAAFDEAPEAFMPEPAIVPSTNLTPETNSRKERVLEFCFAPVEQANLTISGLDYLVEHGGSDEELLEGYAALPESRRKFVKANIERFVRLMSEAGLY